MVHMVKGRQYNNAQSMRVHALVTEMNSTDRLLTSIVDKKRQIDISVTEMNSIAQYRSVQYVARAYAYCMHECMYVCWDYRKERVKFDQPYLSEKVTRSF